MLRLFILTTGFAIAAGAAGMPEQATRGKDIFFDASKKTQCATCHQLEGKGSAIGPDLTKIARLSPKAISVAILASRTVYAKEVNVRVGRKFPAMIVSETADSLKVFDLSKTPPEEMTLDRASVVAVKDNATWRHPPESTGYTKEQLADVIAYIRYASYGETKGVASAEVK